jgi:DNA-binding MarR family transcriptional regulator
MRQKFTSLDESLGTAISFPSQHDKVMVNLVFTYNFFLEKTLRALDEFGINDQHYNILKILSNQSPQPVSMGELKKRLFNKRGDLTRLLDKLADMGMVVREMNSENRRMVLVTISQRGQEQLDAMDLKFSTQRDPKENITVEQAAQLNTLLDKLRG